MKTQFALFLSATLLTTACFASYLGEVSKLLIQSASGARVSMSPVAQDIPDFLNTLTTASKSAFKGFTYIGTTVDGRLVFVKAETKGRQYTAIISDGDQVDGYEENGPAVAKILILRALNKAERSAIAAYKKIDPPARIEDSDAYFRSLRNSPTAIMNDNFLSDISDVLLASVGPSLYEKDVATMDMIQKVTTAEGVTHVKLGLRIETARINAVILEKLLTNIMRSRGR